MTEPIDIRKEAENLIAVFDSPEIQAFFGGKEKSVTDWLASFQQRVREAEREYIAGEFYKKSIEFEVDSLNQRHYDRAASFIRNLPPQPTETI